MLFKNIDMSKYIRIIDIRGRGLTEQELTTIRASGSDIDHVSYRGRPKRFLEIDYEIRAKDKKELRTKIDEVSAIIKTTEYVPVVFSDEPNRTYYCEYAGAEESLEYHHIGIHRGTIFLLRDKDKYGPEKTLTFPADTVVIENNGTAEADPIFELTTRKKTTFAMVSSGADEDSKYNLLGTPADDDVEVVDTKQTIYKLDGMGGWSSSGVQADSRFPKVTGTMQYDGTGMRPNSYGTGDKIHGPGVIRELDESIQDFEIKAIFDVISERDIDNFRLEIDFFDENMNNIGALGIKDNTAHRNIRVGLGRVGNYRGSGVQNGYIIGEDNYTKENFSDNTLMHMTMKREGKEFYFKIGRWRVNRLNDVLEGTYHDLQNEFMGKLKYVQVLIGSWGDRLKPARLRINKIDVIKLTQTTVDQTPYILYPGDKVTFDHKNDDLLINGEPRMDLKNFGGSFFKLNKGENLILVSPEDSFDAKVTYRDKYL